MKHEMKLNNGPFERIKNGTSKARNYASKKLDEVKEKVEIKI